MPSPNKTMDIRLFVVCHKPTPLPQQEPFVPIQVGGGASIPGVALRDNTGDNIAEKNPNYCELTAQYWIWKNVKADVVGLCHYRRIPSFSGVTDETFADFSEATCKKFGWDWPTINNLLTHHDVLMPPCWPVFPPGEPGNIMTPYAFHAYEHRESDIAETLKVIHDLTPEMDCFAHQALCVDTVQCFGNICVMRKPLFDAYSEWLFKILFELERRIEIPTNKEQARVFGFLSERLIMVWLAYARERLGINVWFAPMCPLGNFPESKFSGQVMIPCKEKVKHPLLSVIIPVYNVERYLFRCLNSVCSQCEENIEILCVNDGSSDGSRAILEAFAQKDRRIQIINQRNRGLGAARNRGIEKAKGKWLAFVDSDDWVDRFIWYRSLRKAEKYHLDMLLFEPQDVLDGTEEYLDNNWNRLRLPTTCLQGTFTWRDLGRSPFDTCCYAYNRVIRKDFLGSRRFPEGVLYEDAALHFDLLFSAKRIGALACPYYFYRRRSNSLMGIHNERVLDHLRILDAVAERLRQLTLFDELKTQFLNYATHILRQTYTMWPTIDCMKRLQTWLKARPQYNWGWANADTRSKAIYHAIRKGNIQRLMTAETRNQKLSRDAIHLISTLRPHIPARALSKQLLPYGVMCAWLRERYGIVEDVPLMAYTGTFKRAKRVVKFALPYGVVKAWKRIQSQGGHQIAPIPNVSTSTNTNPSSFLPSFDSHRRSPCETDGVVFSTPSPVDEQNEKASSRTKKSAKNL